MISIPASINTAMVTLVLPKSIYQKQYFTQRVVRHIGVTGGIFAALLLGVCLPWASSASIITTHILAVTETNFVPKWRSVRI